MGPLSSIKAMPTVDQVMQRRNVESKASIRQSSDLRPKMQQRFVIALDTAATSENPMVVYNPFNGYFVEAATDTTVSIRASMGGVDKYNTDNYVALAVNSSAKMDEPVKQAVLTWTAQPGKSITLVFFLGVDFRPGSIISVTTGGVSVTDGSSISESLLGSLGTASSVTVTTTATMILPANSSRKVATLDTSANIQIGGAAVTATTGKTVQAGGFQISNTAAIYAITAVGTATITGIVES